MQNQDLKYLVFLKRAIVTTSCFYFLTRVPEVDYGQCKPSGDFQWFFRGFIVLNRKTEYLNFESDINID